MFEIDRNLFSFQHPESHTATFSKSYARWQLHIADKGQLECFKINTFVTFPLRLPKRDKGAVYPLCGMIADTLEKGKDITGKDVLQKKYLVRKGQ